MNVANITAEAINQGLTRGFQSWPAKLLCDWLGILVRGLASGVTLEAARYVRWRSIKYRHWLCSFALPAAMVDTANTAFRRQVFCRDLDSGFCGSKIQVFPDGDLGDFVAKN